jgi:hypothetical protein
MKEKSLETDLTHLWQKNSEKFIHLNGDKFLKVVLVTMWKN